ncbi:MAG: extracellular solute-binding protein, partial [Melioribacteraceae bacterium]|nr:extracellular solute-binding protein [Melioribacteraceae bacterium]
MLKISRNSNYLYWTIIAFVLLLSVSYYVFSFLFSGERKSQIDEIYFADNITPAHTILIEKFNKEYEGRIKVVAIDLPFSKFSTNERKEILTRSLRGKSNRIDIFSVDHIWVKRFAKWAEPLDKYFSVISRRDIIPKAMESCFFKERLYAIPFKIDISTMFYRHDLLSKIEGYENILQKFKESITWQEFIRIGMSLPQYKNNYYLFTANNYEGLVSSFLELVLNMDENFFLQKKSFNSEIGYKALKLLVDLVNDYQLTPIEMTRAKEFQAHQYFANNDVLFLRSWPTFSFDYHHYFSEELKKDIRPIPLPHLSGTPTANILGGWNLMISEFSNHKDEAAEFIRYLLLDENQKILYENSGSLPIKSSFYSDIEEDVNNSSDVAFYKKLIDRGIHRPFLEDYTRISDILSYYTNLAITKEISIDSAL